MNSPQRPKGTIEGSGPLPAPIFALITVGGGRWDTPKPSIWKWQTITPKQGSGGLMSCFFNYIGPLILVLEKSKASEGLDWSFWSAGFVWQISMNLSFFKRINRIDLFSGKFEKKLKNKEAFNRIHFLAVSLILINNSMLLRLVGRSCWTIKSCSVRVKMKFLIH